MLNTTVRKLLGLRGSVTVIVLSQPSDVKAHVLRLFGMSVSVCQWRKVDECRS